MELWVGSQLMLSFQMVVLFVSFFYIHEINKIVITYKDAAGLWWADRFRPYVTMAANLISNIILVQIIGVYGIILSSVISMVITVPWAAIVLYKGLFKSEHVIRYFCTILKYTFFVVISSAVSYFVCNLVKIENGYISIMVKLIICLVLPNVVLTVLNCRNPLFQQAMKRVIPVFLRRH